MIKALVNQYKIYIYIALAALLITGWLFDRHHQYNKGVAQCQLKQAEAQADYWQERSKRLAVEGKEALKQEQSVSKVINERTASKAAKVERSVELEKVSKRTDCGWDDDELRHLNETIREANGT